jgi:hypothetical protein
VAILGLIVLGSLSGLGFRVCRHDAAIHEIVRVGGVFKTRPGGPVWIRQFSGGQWFSQAFEDVPYINLEKTQINDDDMATIARLTGVEELQLGNTKLSDLALARLASCDAFKKLWLNDTAISDAGLNSIMDLRLLGDLDLRGTRVTDIGLANLASFIEPLSP